MSGRGEGRQGGREVVREIESVSLVANLSLFIYIYI